MSTQNPNEPISRRKFLKYAGVAAAAAAVAACAPTTTATPAATSAPAATAAGPTAPAVIAKPFAGRELNIFSVTYHHIIKENVVPAFADKTGAKVNWNEVGDDDTDTKFGVFAASQDSSMDVLYAWEGHVAKFRTLFADITDKVNASLVKGLVPATATAFSRSGRLFGIPFDSNLEVFMWNTDHYTAAGLDPNTPPATWADFMSYSKKLTTPDHYATWIPMSGQASFALFAALFNSTGQKVFNDDLTKIDVDNPAGLQVVNAVFDAVVTSKVVDPASLTATSSIDQGKTFRTGKFSHYIAFPNHYTLAQDPTQSQIVGKAKTGLIPGLNKRSGTINGFEGYALNTYGKNQDVGLAFLEFTLDPTVQKEVAINWGRPPSMQATYDDPDVIAKSPQFATVKEQGQYVSNRYGSPFYGDVATTFDDHFDRMFKGSETPQAALTAMQTESQKIVDAYWAKVK